MGAMGRVCGWTDLPRPSRACLDYPAGVREDANVL